MSDYQDFFNFDNIEIENHRAEIKEKEIEDNLNEAADRLVEIQKIQLDYLGKYINLQKEYLNIHADDRKSMHIPIDIKSDHSTYVQIIIQDLVPAIPKIISAKNYSEMRNEWDALLREALTNYMSETKKVSFPQAFIVVEYNSKNGIRADIDNRFRSFIADTLTKSNLIPDDDFNALTWIEKGRYKQKKDQTVITLINQRHRDALTKISGILRS